MSLKCGVVGLPNVGKSTLFNAITNTATAESANYPFCTIEPNSGIVKVYDQRLEKLAKIADSEKIIQNTLEVIDIAGLVRGASKGEGLGNQFLGNIRQVDAILHVVRCFKNDDVIHVDGKIRPLEDISTIETELLLSDISVLEKRSANLAKKAKNDKIALQELSVIEKILPLMNSGTMAKNINLSEIELETIKALQLITAKPVIYVCNTDEASFLNGNEFTKQVEDFVKSQNSQSVKICAQVEAEMSSFSQEEKAEMLQELGISSSVLELIAQKAFYLLNLITFFTVGPKEARAWSASKGAFAPQAAGAIHTDFEKGFIKAEKISYEDYVKYNGENLAKENGKMSLEGKTYVVQDGDVMHFKFNV